MLSGFYVIRKRLNRTQWLLGPFPTHAAADHHVSTAMVHELGGDPFAGAGGFEVASITRRPNNPAPLPLGRLNFNYPGIGYGPVVIPPVAPLPVSERWGKNYDNAKHHRTSPCCICGKTVPEDAASIAVDAQTSDMLSPVEAARREADPAYESDQCCYYPVGPECAKRADVRPYVQRP